METIDWKDIKFSVLTISNRCFSGQAEDISGKKIVDAFQSLGAVELATFLVPDEINTIQTQMYSCVSNSDILISTGGTGLTPQDVTPEAAARVIERPAPGISELLRSKGFDQTPMSCLSRGVSGVAQNCLIITLPGSPRAVEQAISILVPIIPHAVALLRGQGFHG